MGNRGLLGLIVKARRHGAYYNGDSYPSGLGQDIVNFILSLTPEDIAAMARLVSEITWVDEKSTPSPELQERYMQLGYCDLRFRSQKPDDWGCLLHRMQGAPALPAIQSGHLRHLAECVDFLEDTLFCEWAYFIDFENQKLETWDHGEMRHEISFETLVKEGKGYMERFNGPDDDDDDESDDESDSGVCGPRLKEGCLF